MSRSCAVNLMLRHVTWRTRGSLTQRKEKEDSLGYLAIGRAELARAEGRLDDVQGIVDTTAQAIARLRAFSDAAEMVWSLAEIGLDAVATACEIANAAADVRLEAATHRRVDRGAS